LPLGLDERDDDGGNAEDLGGETREAVEALVLRGFEEPSVM
jgi:hypothetical protein